MTHAIYIAAILVLAGVACWLWRSSARSRHWADHYQEIYETEHRECNRLIGKWADACEEGDKLDSLIRKEHSKHQSEAASWVALHDKQAEDIGALVASNRSLRGWNGRYRRRIAELEGDVEAREQRIEELVERLYVSDEEDEA